MNHLVARVLSYSAPEAREGAEKERNLRTRLLQAVDIFVRYTVNPLLSRPPLKKAPSL